MTKKMLCISGLDVWSMGYGKGAQSLYLTLTGYADSGWQVFFVTGNKGPGKEYKIHPNVTIIRFDLPWLKLFFAWRILSHIAKGLWWVVFQIAALYLGILLNRREKIDLLYGYDTLGVPAGYLIAKIFRKPFVSRFQGSTIGFFINKRLWRMKFWDQILALKTPSDLLIMTNDGQQEDRLLERLGVDMSRVRFWMNGVNKELKLPDNFEISDFKRKIGIETEDKIILTVNRLHRWKRIDRVIAAMPAILEQEPRARLLIVGGGMEYSGLVKLSEELLVRHRVVFAGSVTHEELPGYYAIADVFVSCNDSANIGNPLLEAMVSGKCIVTLNNGSTGDLIKNGETGLLLDMNQIDSMGNVVAGLIREEGKRERLGRNAKNFARRNLRTWQERIHTEVEAVNELVNRKKELARMKKVFIMSSVHNWEDPRIFHKQATTLKTRYQVELHAVAPFSYKEINGVPVFGLKHRGHRLLRSMNWFCLLIRACRSDAAVFHFHDPELIPLGCFLKMVKRKKVIYDVHEHSKETILTREWIPSFLRGFAASLVGMMEKVTAGFFCGIIVADDEMAKSFAGNRNIAVIRNYPPNDFGKKYFEVIKPGQINSEPGDDRTKTIIYVGVMGKDRGLETVLKAMPLVRSRKPEAVCRLVGRVSYKGLSPEYRDNISFYLKAGNIQITGQLSYTETIAHLASSDVGWTPFPPITKHRWGIGTKLTEYMAMALPVVASDYGEGAEVVKSEKCGLVVDPLQSAAHADAIVTLLDNKDLARELGRNGREAYLQRYCWESQSVKLLEFYQKVLA